ncbi:MAG TPA: hypothetical protein VK695_04750 [Steroidobacteraceae bacterium]|jgi:pimeloyl-ACP methyl ester carboxylesterase|nr:hypothetical protein [Steroidobacteraceae bacterium]
MHLVSDAARPGSFAPCCIVMLPAAFCRPEDFVQQGFVSAVRARALAVDLCFAQPEGRHLTDRSVLARLREEIVLPAHARGATVWLGGISLGGFLAASYAARHGAELRGLCLLAPYLGSHLITGEIQRAGGVQAWQPGALPDGDDDEQRVWQLLKRGEASGFALHLGLGAADRFASRHRLLAAALPPASVDEVAGGHDWPTWRKLWENFLLRRIA